MAVTAGQATQDRQSRAAGRHPAGPSAAPGTIRSTAHLRPTVHRGTVSRKRVERVMRQHGIRARTPRRYRVCTTDSKHCLPVAANLLEQNFVAHRPDQVWLADITYIPTSEGWLYLAVIRRQPVSRILQAAAITPSMSRKANWWDNAPMESFSGTLKTELVHHRGYADRDTARRELFAYIEGYYIVRGSTPPSGTSPHSRQRQKPHNPVSTFSGEGQLEHLPISWSPLGSSERQSRASYEPTTLTDRVRQPPQRLRPANSP